MQQLIYLLCCTEIHWRCNIYRELLQFHIDGIVRNNHAELNWEQRKLASHTSSGSTYSTTTFAFMGS